MNDFEPNLENAILAVDSHFGIFTPQVFIERFEDNLEHDMKNIADILADLSSPDNEYYWDAWASIIDNCTVTIDGDQYSIYEDEDVWFVPIN